tara:strand:+ start:251 stop:1933 length:1683 start_codon:yes stop_codon:yes gene_type:complete
VKVRVIFFLFLIISLGSTSNLAQVKYELKFSNTTLKKKFSKFISIDTSITLSENKSIRSLGNSLIAKGYFLYALRQDTALKQVSVDLGDRFSEIEIRNLQDTELNIFKRKNKSATFSPDELSAFLVDKLSVFSNQGFPFVNVSLDSIEIENLKIRAVIKLNKGRYFTLRKIHIRGDSSISNSTIHGIIDYSIDEVYSEEKIGAIDQKIKQTSFISTIKPSEIMYTNDGFELFLYLKSTKVSYLRGALGLQPNPISQRMALTGELNLKLENALKKGELFKFNWRSIKPQTQRMKLNLNYPYLFQSPFGIESNLLLYKRDSTFLDLNTELNVSYSLKNGFRIRAHYRFMSSSILSGGSSSLEFSNLNSYRTNAYGLSIERQALDNIVNPSKGRILNAKLYVGQRILSGDSTDAAEKNTTYLGNILYREYVSIFPRHVLLFGLLFDFYTSPTIFENELFRFGGLNTLRGFNEEQLFASTKGQLTFEYRFLLDENSNVFLFYDQCFYENTSVSYKNDHPLGFGGGISFGSKIGIFSITYALGREQANPIDFRSSKIHFGYTAYF